MLVRVVRDGGESKMTVKADTSWIKEICLQWQGRCPADLLERLMADERCVAFGPIHHCLVGASLLACAQRAPLSGGEIAATEASCESPARAQQALPTSLDAALDTLFERAHCVPGAACAQWGVCGAAASCGMAFAIMAENAPLKAAGWSEGQAMVSEILAAIAKAGAPRCCKRDSRIAVQVALPWFNEHFDAGLEQPSQVPVCASMPHNTVCMGPACVYHP